MADCKTGTVEYTNSFDGTGPLLADVYYADRPEPRPLVVMMHGFSRGRSAVAHLGPVLADWGLFAVAPDMRGHGESAGQADCGRMEIHDVFDAVQACLATYGRFIDANSLNLWGWSGGGGNAFSCVAKMPDLFRQAAAFFGICDYAHWIQDQPRFEPKTVEWHGGTPEHVPARYAASRSLSGVRNSTGTRFHLFWDAEETKCTPWFNHQWLEAATRLGLQDVVGHESRPEDARRWAHGYPRNDNDCLYACREILAPEILSGAVRPSSLPPEGELTVLGYVLTGRFRVYLGDGTAAVARLKYSVKDKGMTFDLREVISENPTARARILIARPPACAAPTVTLDASRVIPTEFTGEMLDNPDIPLTAAVAVRW